MFIGAVAATAATAAPVAAHTEFESSQPSHGDLVDQPVSEISLTFTRSIELVADDLLVVNELGLQYTPDAVDSADGQTWVLRYETPLGTGRFEVYWRAAAADGHFIEGAFAFAIALFEAERSPVPSAGTPEVPDAQSSESVGSPTPEHHEPSSSPTASPSVSEIPSTPQADTTASLSPEATDTAHSSFTAKGTERGAADRSTALSTSRRSGATKGQQRLADAARILTVLSTLGIVGGLAFMAFIVRGEPLDWNRARNWVVVFGYLLAASTVVASLNRAAVVEREWAAFWSPESVADAVWSNFGAAAGLRMAGGLLVAVALYHMAKHPGRIPTAAGAFAGGVLVVGSYVFDGHTVTEGPRWLHALASASHVSAAAIWSCGVALLADLLWRRHRRGADFVRPLTRFSRMAAIALVVAGVGGSVMAFLVLDKFTDLWSTPWGRLLLAKIALVAVAAGIGAHNRWRLIPAVNRPGAAETHRRLRRNAVVEAIALGCVGVITAFLVAASPV
ncbi:copper resistance CopC/CopD family protein [Candidatus Poriferisocius sp.]|uniref:copper resistance CopC/CopD family protein n=1 Tax=Candidatus Poriferisocius sp. TaxID=3101276 RepID=UPI003B5275BF